MKVTVIGSHLCPDTLYALNRLSEVKAEIEFKNLSASLPDLKAYLALRDSDPHYEAVKKNGGIGIPAFVLEDGTVTLDLGWALIIVLGLVGSLFGQIGDLSFSVIKREYGIKDYGTIFPGHGGVLDRFDSVLFVSPAYYLIITAVMA